MALKADINFTSDLFDAANKLRGSVAPSEYKNYVLPLIFLRYLSLRYEKRREELEALENNPNSDWYMEDLDMDHIVPLALHGSNDSSNLQILAISVIIKNAIIAVQLVQ